MDPNKVGRYEEHEVREMNLNYLDKRKVPTDKTEEKMVSFVGLSDLFGKNLRAV